MLSFAFVLCFSLHTKAQLSINTIAGNGTGGFSGDSGPATAAEINTPYGVAVDLIGNVYFTDEINNRIRKIDTFGVITTIAGNGTPGFFGDTGPATLAQLYSPRGIAVDGSGNVFFSDYGNSRIREITPSGMIYTFAGNGLATFSGDGGLAYAAGLNFPWGLAIDGAGNMFIADQVNCRVRKVNTSGIISTIGGTGFASFSGDGGAATAAMIQYPMGVALDGAGNIYVADNGNNRVRKINSSGIISTIAGSPVFGFTGDGGPSTDARLYLPEGIATDAAGNVYIADLNNKRIRQINTSGIINTITGNGTVGFSGDGGPPTLAAINQSTGVAVDGSGRVYIADNGNNRIRILHVVLHPPSFVGGHEQHLTFCATEAVSIDSLLAVTDLDVGQTETWSLIDGPFHGAALAGYTTTSTGSTMVPAGLYYYMGVGSPRTDTFKVRVTDGGLSDTTTIYVTIQYSPVAGTITGIDSLCPADSVVFADTTTGGTWSLSNTAVSTISPTGLVTGLSPGTVNILYSVSNLCGTTTASFPLIVRSGCPTGVNEIASLTPGKLNISPNPNNGNFTADLKPGKQEDIHFTITNVLGKVVKEFTSADNPINIRLDEPPGIYFICAITVYGTWVNKLVIRK